MPTVDADGRIVGILLREDRDTGNYSSCYVVINFTSRLLNLYPLEAEGAKDFTEFIPIEEIKCSYITKVNIASSRPKILNCFELVTTGVSRFFSVNSAEERDEWIETIKQSSMSQAAGKAFTTTQKEKPQDIGYRNQVIGGVVQRRPIKEIGAVVDEERSDLTSSGPATIGATATALENSSPTKHKGFPRIIKAGHATKCGAVMKNWKRRFFVLSEISLGYYKSIDETEPIRTVSVGEMLSVGRDKMHHGKEHLLELVTPSRIFHIQADNQSDMDDWIKAFQQAIGSLRSSSTSLPISTKERSGSSSGTLDSQLIQIYDASPKPITGDPARWPRLHSDSSSPELSNGEDYFDGEDLVGTEV